MKKLIRVKLIYGLVGGAVAGIMVNFMPNSTASLSADYFHKLISIEKKEIMKKLHTLDNEFKELQSQFNNLKQSNLKQVQSIDELMANRSGNTNRSFDPITQTDVTVNTNSKVFANLAKNEINISEMKNNEDEVDTIFEYVEENILAEVIDEAWAINKQTELENIFQKDELVNVFSVIDMQCLSTACLIRLSLSDDPIINEKAILHLELSGETILRVSDEDPNSMIVYTARQGFSLPEFKH